MSAVGMRHLVFAPITTHTDGSAITYGTGLAIEHAVRGDVTFNWSEGKSYANDVEDDSYKKLLGADLEVESSVWPDNVMTMLGLAEETGSGTNIYSTVIAPDTEVGFGFIQVLREERTTKYCAWWFHKVIFTPADVNAATQEEDIDWTHASLAGSAKVCYLANNEVSAEHHEVFTTEAAAKTWLNGLAGIT